MRLLRAFLLEGPQILPLHLLLLLGSEVVLHARTPPPPHQDSACIWTTREAVYITDMTAIDYSCYYVFSALVDIHCDEDNDTCVNCELSCSA